jgi:hypothetical protein
MLAELENGSCVSCENARIWFFFLKKVYSPFNCMLLFDILQSPDLVKTRYFVQVVLDTCPSCFPEKAGITKKLYSYKK